MLRPISGKRTQRPSTENKQRDRVGKEVVSRRGIDSKKLSQKTRDGQPGSLNSKGRRPRARNTKGHSRENGLHSMASRLPPFLSSSLVVNILRGSSSSLIRGGSFVIRGFGRLDIDREVPCARALCNKHFARCGVGGAAINLGTRGSKLLVCRKACGSHAGRSNFS